MREAMQRTAFPAKMLRIRRNITLATLVWKYPRSLDQEEVLLPSYIRPGSIPKMAGTVLGIDAAKGSLNSAGCSRTKK